MLSDLPRKELRHALKRADAAIYKDVLQYLEVDFREMSSGYRKELIWKYIKRYQLDPSAINRLESVALSYLERSMSHEYKYMCQTMARIATPQFWQSVKERISSDSWVVALNAYCLFPYSEGIYKGEAHRLWLNELRWRCEWSRELRYRHHANISVEDLKALINNQVFWKNGYVATEIGNSPYIASRYYDELFTSIDWSQCLPKVLIPRLGEVLLASHIDGLEALETATYVAYALGKMRSELAVSFLIRFLEVHVDHKFDSTKKYTIQVAVFVALKQIGTPEALEAIKQRANQHLQHYVDNYFYWA
jgi:hypothetical protein